ncbi:hypothetical protein VTK56DRAFT_7597 [Thermocarpiscus australiensis]
MSFAAAVALLDLSDAEADELAELAAREQANMERYSRATTRSLARRGINGYLAAAEAEADDNEEDDDHLARVTAELAPIAETITGDDVRLGMEFLNFMGLNEEAAALVNYQGVGGGWLVIDIHPGEVRSASPQVGAASPREQGRGDRLGAGGQGAATPAPPSAAQAAEESGAADRSTAAVAVGAAAAAAAAQTIGPALPANPLPAAGGGERIGRGRSTSSGSVGLFPWENARDDAEVRAEAIVSDATMATSEGAILGNRQDRENTAGA